MSSGSDVWAALLIREGIQDPDRGLVIRPQLVKRADGEWDAEGLNAELARMQVQLNRALIRLGFAGALGTVVGEVLTPEEEKSQLFFSGQIISFTTRIQNVDVAHTLGRVPVGYMQGRTDGAVSIYDGTTPWTENLISFRADANNVACDAWIF